MNKKSQAKVMYGSIGLLILIGIFSAYFILILPLISANPGLTDNILRYYNFDEANGDLIDQVGSNDGTTTGVTYGAAGKIGDAYTFGSGDKVIMSTSDIEGRSSITVNLWAKRSSIANDEGCLNKNDVIQFPVTRNGDFEMLLDTASGRNRPANSITTDTAWHMWTFTYDGSNIRFYMDGSLQDTVAATGAIDTFGGYDYGFGAWISWSGEIDECVIFTDVKDQTDITELYNSGDGLAYPFAVGTNTQINIGDTWKAISAMKINIGDTWKDVAGVQVNIGDTWKTIF